MKWLYRILVFFLGVLWGIVGLCELGTYIPGEWGLLYFMVAFSVVTVAIAFSLEWVLGDEL